MKKGKPSIEVVSEISGIHKTENRVKNESAMSHYDSR